MAKFKICYANECNKERTEVFEKILQEECQSFEVVEDYKQVYISTSGTAKVAIFHNKKYIGYHYAHLVSFLQEEGLMLC